ncbi:MAG: hypothetical protein EZS28_024883 [Streblomastix strix]|uniref:Uncharacterized protein n=1 Tax=Streblomastix strix TaxID=222440 RepID=A0A5J4VAS8_9EUKA|nr:MAG: hypothetical protein EZS28_024883 [Streblomastix strix]
MWSNVQQAGPEGIKIQQVSEMTVQNGGVLKPTTADESGAHQSQNACHTGREWLQPFTNKGLSPKEEAGRKEMLTLENAVLENYYHIIKDKLDQANERASEETRMEITRREQMIRILFHKDKAVKALPGDKFSPVERETQIFAIHAQNMIEAAIISLIVESNVIATDQRKIFDRNGSTNCLDQDQVGESKFQEELDQKLKLGVVRQAKDDEMLHLNQSYTVPETGGIRRKIPDCSELIAATKPAHFRMKNINTVM